MVKDFDPSFLYGSNAFFLEELYKQYIDNPEDISSEWKDFFHNIGEDRINTSSVNTCPSWSKRDNSIIMQKTVSCAKDFSKKISQYIPCDELNSQAIIEAYRVHGHLIAKLDPLDLEIRYTKEELSLNPSDFGLNDHNANNIISVPKNIKSLKGDITAIQLINFLNNVYCSNIGFDFSHIHNKYQRDWLYEKAEEINSIEISKEERIKILKDLIEVESFEQCLHSKFPGAKRFSIEGGDSTIIALSQILHTAANFGVEQVILGMPHRGRLNVLTKIMGKSYRAMFSEFKGNPAYIDNFDMSGDVKYHMGKSSDYKDVNGHVMHLSLCANPSHLEAVNPVVIGKVRAKQDYIKDTDRRKVMGILLHGDAAFCGQGVVAETLSLANLDGYSTGGTMHIVVNNQIGFTTMPNCARSSRYPTEFAKIIQAPVIHVNGDDPESVYKISRLAEEFREKFQTDIVIDLVCYRRYGHNEGDEPMFTQPKMYNIIHRKETTAVLYAKNLISNSVINDDGIINIRNIFKQFLDKEFDDSSNYKPVSADWLQDVWQNIKPYDKNNVDIINTGIKRELLVNIGRTLSKVPADFNLNSKLERLMEAKVKMMETGENIDWSMGEALAYGSLLVENYPIRITGQDSCRGTFSHRHSVLIDQKNESTYVPLNNIDPNQAKFEVHNSHLSEFAVLGFEYGYSLVNPNGLTIWEAQFGDFSNGAQIIIDQFISSSEYKWMRMSAITMLLPHGYEGQGPEHSSARLERYLQLCAEHNMQVVNCTTPANFFHVIRRQLHRNFRKPLIIMSPKSLLRHKLAVSNLNDFELGTKFRPVIGEVSKIGDNDTIKKVIICSGKLYYDLYEAREKSAKIDVVIIRMEQYYPFPKDELLEELKKYQNAEIVWCQEEPKNMGAWKFVFYYIENVLIRANGKCKRPLFIGRANSASPASGYLKKHNEEQQKLIEQALCTN